MFVIASDISTEDLLAHACESLASASIMATDFATFVDGTQRSMLLGIQQVIRHVYYARVDINVTNPTGQSVLFYDAFFCVVQKHDDGLFYLQYIYDQNGKEVGPSLCPV